jgi:chorismate mutase
MKKVENYRKEIDRIDSEISKLLDRRLEIVESLAPLKNSIEDLSREKEVLDSVSNNSEMYGTYISSIYKEIFNQSKILQNSLKDRE